MLGINQPRAAEVSRRRALALTSASALFFFAASAAQADTTVQGEALSFNSSKAVGMSDPAADGGRTLKIYSNAAASRSVATASNSVRLLVRARGQQCEGAPRMTVAVGGTRRLSASVSSSSYASYSSVLSLPKGTHGVSVAFVNDRLTSRCDRNLLVDSVRLVSSAPPASPATPTPTQPSTTTTPTPPPTTTPTPPPTTTPTPPPATTPTPPPTTTPAQPPTEPAASQLRPDYDAAWGTANYANGAIGPFKGVVHRERISIVDDPAGLNRKVARFAPKDSDIGPTDNPRTQLELPRFIDDGEEVWQGLSMFYPADFPKKVSSPGGGSFVTHTSQAAPPHAGTTKVSFGSYGGDYKFGARLSGGGTYAWAIAPRVGVWHDFIIRMKVGQSGFLEMWHNDGSGLVKQDMSNTGPGGTVGSVSADRKRWIGTTNDPSTQTPPLDSRLALYWKRGMWTADPVLFYGPAKWRVRKSGDVDAALLQAVDPRSHGN